MRLPPANRGPVRLLPIRLFYLVVFAGLGAVLPYLSVYLRNSGLTGTQIGLLYMFQAIVAIIIAPLVGRIADRAHNPERISVVGLLVAAVAGATMGLISAVAIVAAASIVMKTGSDVALPVADGLAIRQTQRDGKVSYGGIRNFGSAGWILTAPLAGLIAQRLGMPLLFSLFAILTTIAVVLLAWASREVIARPDGSRPKAPTEPPTRPPDKSTTALTAGMTFRRALGNRLLLSSAIGLFVHGLFRQAIFRFEPVYLDTLGVQLGGIGAAASIPAVIELIAMPVAGRLAKRMGPAYVIAAGMIVNIVRVAAVALWPVPAVVVATKILDGVSYGFETIGVVELVAGQSRGESLRATMALFTVSLVQVIGMVGNPIAGMVYDAAGAHPLYFLSLAGSAVGAVIIAAAGRRTRRVHQP